MSIDYTERARALVGTPFRPQGRGELGLDCVGVAIATFGLRDVRANYRLRGDHAGEVREYLRAVFRRVPTAQVRPGDLKLMQVADDQIHLGVRTRAGFVHAHAGVRRVVETHGNPERRVLGVYRARRR